ncbi:MAG: pyruvate kinase alpha/beta domain-containing protein, partial [Myxococcota bacterium]
MSALASSAEGAPEAFEAPDFVAAIRSSHAWAICRAAVVTADEIQADALVSYTNQGLGPRLVAHWRPKCLVIGCAQTDEEVRRMGFFWGVRPLKLVPPTSLEGLLAAVENAGLDEGLLKAGQTIVITTKIPFTDTQTTNMLKIHSIER